MPIQMVGCHSHKDCNSTHNRPKTADAVLKIWSTRINCLRQWSTVCCSRISKILLEKWNLTSLLHLITQHQRTWRNEMCKDSREAIYKKFSEGTVEDRVARFVLQNMLSHHTKPLDVVQQNYCSEESYELV